MDNLRALIFFSLLFFSSLTQASVWGLWGACSHYPSGGCAATFSDEGSARTAVDGWISGTSDHNHCVFGVAGTNSYTCAVTSPAGDFLGSVGWQLTSGSACPTSGSSAGSGYVDMGTSPNVSSPNLCNGTCTVQFSGSFPASRALVGGVYHYFGSGTLTNTGDTCSPSAAVSAGSSVPSSTCATGQVLGQFNGVDTCLSSGNPVNPNSGATGSTTATGPSNTTTSSTSGGTTTTTSTTTNPDGSTSTTTKVCTSTDNCTSTTTNAGNDPAGPDSDFCKNNPKNKLCQDEKSTASAACSGGSAVVACSGDGIQCAILQEQTRQDCLLDATTTESGVYNAAIAGTDTGNVDNPAATANRTTIALASSLDQSTHFTASCFSDHSYTIMGSSVTIPFSTVCPWLAMFGNILVVISLISAAKIVGVR